MNPTPPCHPEWRSQRSAEGDVRGDVRGNPGSEIYKEMYDVQAQLGFRVDASAFTGPLLRTDSGRATHLSSKQFWVYGAVHGFGMKAGKVKREYNDSLTHSGSEKNFRNGLRHLRFFLR